MLNFFLLNLFNPSKKVLKGLIKLVIYNPLLLLHNGIIIAYFLVFVKNGTKKEAVKLPSKQDYLLLHPQ